MERGAGGDPEVIGCGLLAHLGNNCAIARGPVLRLRRWGQVHI